MHDDDRLTIPAFERRTLEALREKVRELEALVATDQDPERHTALAWLRDWHAYQLIRREAHDHE